jgi:hypothetical protein
MAGPDGDNDDSPHKPFEKKLNKPPCFDILL